MKNILLASVAILFVGATASLAAMPALDLEPTFSVAAQHDLMLLAKDGRDDSDSDDNSGSDNSGSDDSDDSNDDNGGDRDDSSSDDSNDDNGGDRNRNRRSNDDSNDDSPQSNSNRDKPRIPGGSGCDDAGDIAEHAECRAP